MKEYIRRLRECFGWKFIGLLFITQCLLKGIAFAIMTIGLFPMFKYMGIDAIQLQVLATLALSPWTVKPLIGVLSDLIAIGGYHKRYWMIISMVAGITGGFFMIFGLHASPMVIAFFVLLIHFEIAVCDLLMEGKYAEIMRTKPESGSDIVTLSSGMQQLGGIIALCFIGPLADAQLFFVSNIVVCVALVTPLAPLLLGWMPEERTNVLFDMVQFKDNWKIITVAAITGLTAPATGAITAFANKTLGMTSAAVVLIIVLLGGYTAMPHRLIAHVALYQALTAASRISFSGALDFFFTADATCLPGGPGFSNTFYITTTGLIGTVASLITAFLYQFVFSEWKYRTVLVFTSILSGLGGIFDFIIVQRWNVAWGIPDRVFFILGDDVIHSVVEMLYWIPSSAIIGKVCPDKMEACTYAYLAGVSNFARMLSSITGAWMTELFGINTVGGDCNWTALPWLILFGHIVANLAVSIPAAWLIPKRGQREDLLSIQEVPLTEVEPEPVELDEL